MTPTSTSTAGNGSFAILHVGALAVAAYAFIVTEHAGFGASLHAPHWLVIAAIIFVAASVSSIVGFAFSAIAGAAMLQATGDAVEAVQIMIVASIGIQAYSVAGLWRSIRWRRCVPFIAGGMFALPVGFALLLRLPAQWGASAIGAGLAIYGAYLLVRRPARARPGRRPIVDALAGAVGGITGPLAALPGVGATIWGAMRGWDKLEQRAVYQPYILVMQLVAAAGMAWLKPRGEFDPALLAYAVPAVAGAILGLRRFRSLSDGQFERIVKLMLIASGAALLVK